MSVISGCTFLSIESLKMAVWFGLLVILAGAIASAQSTGSISSIEEYPSLAQVEVGFGLVWLQECNAVVLTNVHVLSVASCFSGPLYTPALRRIRAGTSSRGRDGVVHSVESAAVHPDFGNLGLEADLAVVRLNDPLTLSSTVQQVSILGQGIELPVGLQVKLAGWGATVQGGDSADDDLYSLDLNVHDNENCMIRYYNNHIITTDMVCAGNSFTEGRDFYLQDVGAPLFYENTLIGILSFGEVDDDKLPLVATNIGSYTEWIIDAATA